MSQNWKGGGKHHLMDKERGAVFTRGTLDQMNRQLNFTDSPELEQLAWIAE